MARGARVIQPAGSGGGAMSRLLQRVLKAVTPRSRRRTALLSIAFPPNWRGLLERCSAHYRRLPRDLRHQFEKKVQLFVAERRITGIGIDASDELKLLVAASAVTLSLSWSDYHWEDIGEVLLYPASFGRDYAVGAGEDHFLAGTVHPWGTVILSAPALRASFEHAEDGYHVGIHEFAHLVDVDATRFDGIPPSSPINRSPPGNRSVIGKCSVSNRRFNSGCLWRLRSGGVHGCRDREFFRAASGVTQQTSGTLRDPR
jgi:Glucose-regulated metallo-peptidase M90